MDFSEALLAIKDGSKLTRKGWNGQGQFVVLQKGYPEGISINENTQKALGKPEGTIIKFLPYLLISTVDGSCVPWLASQTDILANDWEVAL